LIEEEDDEDNMAEPSDEEIETFVNQMAHMGNLNTKEVKQILNDFVANTDGAIAGEGPSYRQGKENVWSKEYLMEAGKDPEENRKGVTPEDIMIMEEPDGDEIDDQDYASETRDHVWDEARDQFDAEYQHSSKDERAFLRTLDPFNRHDRPRVQVRPEVLAIHGATRKAMWKMHSKDPVKYHSRKLAAMFGLSLNRTLAILRLKALEHDIEKAYERLGPGFDTEREFSKNLGQEWAELAYGVGLAQWEPEAPVGHGIIEPGLHFVDDLGLMGLRALEKAKRNRFLSVQERMAKQEQLLNAIHGPIGTRPEKPFVPQPVDPEATPQSPNRVNWQMTDISSAKRGRNEFSICVRDKDGTLRHPTEPEFVLVRRREKSSRDFFNHKTLTKEDVQGYYRAQGFSNKPVRHKKGVKMPNYL
jgi:hypothetical protein